MTMRVGINGFGRIGRQVLKAIRRNYAGELEVVAINDITDSSTLRYLLQYDSVHGPYGSKVESNDAGLIIDGDHIPILAERDPARIPWSDFGAEYVLESTGRFTSAETASKHFDAGAKKVLISAPVKGDVDATIVPGVNDDDLKAEYRLITAASCTTNCAAMLLRVLHDEFTVARTMMTVVHAYTNDQSLHDQPHKELRRARAAAVSLIPASTGSATDVAKVIPDLAGKMSSVAIRTPNIDGSIVDLVCELDSSVTEDRVNSAFSHAAAGRLSKYLQYTEDPIVSVDVIGNPASCIFDAQLTTVIEDQLVKVMGWFDNEWGYSNRCADLLHRLAKL